MTYSLETHPHFTAILVKLAKTAAEIPVEVTLLSVSTGACIDKICLRVLVALSATDKRVRSYSHTKRQAVSY